MPFRAVPRVSILRCSFLINVVFAHQSAAADLFGFRRSQEAKKVIDYKSVTT
jgi:hypothetical protein